jgi:hypothetical protein
LIVSIFLMNREFQFHIFSFVFDFTVIF